MTDNPETGTIPWPLDSEQLAETLFEHFSDIELGPVREDDYRVLHCSIFREAKEINFDRDLAIRLSLIIAPRMDIISLTFYSAIREDANLVLLLKYLRKVFSRGPQYNIAFHDQQVMGVSFDHDLRVVPNMPVSALVDTMVWFAKYVTMWHGQLNPFLLDERENVRWSAEHEGEVADNEALDDIVVVDDDEDDDEGDERHPVGDAKFNL